MVRIGGRRTQELPAREAMEFDVVIVGAGPAGLAAAIRLKQLAPETAPVGRRAGEGLRGRRPHPLRRGDRSDRPRPARCPTGASEDAPLKTAVTRRPLLLPRPRRRAAPAATVLMPPLMSNHGNYIVSLGNVCRWLGQQGRGARRRDLSGLRRPPRCSTTRAARSPASPPATWASARTAADGLASRRGMELRGKYTLIAEGARGIAGQAADRALRPRRGPRAAEIRHRPQGAVAGRAREAPARPRAAHVRLAARQQHRRRLVPLPLRRQPGVGRLRRPPQLRQPLSVARSRSSSASRPIR